MVAEQFPDWADLPIRPVKASGWDNYTFHLGTEMSVRLPSAKRYAAQVAKEQTWLPRLAPHLPVPIPTPVAMGLPSHGYPFHWSIMKWLTGTPANQASSANQTQIASDLADFLSALQSAPAENGPLAGPQNFYRGGELYNYKDDVRRCLNELSGHVNVQKIEKLWDVACASRWDRPPVWVHGDIAPGNFLVTENQLCAVIDFGASGIGDPACDLTIAWTYFTGDARETFIRSMGTDANTWARAKGWGIWKALLELCEHKQGAQETLKTLINDD